jgi:hypothetical protein
MRNRGHEGRGAACAAAKVSVCRLDGTSLGRTAILGRRRSVAKCLRDVFVIFHQLDRGLKINELSLCTLNLLERLLQFEITDARHFTQRPIDCLSAGESILCAAISVFQTLQMSLRNIVVGFGFEIERH